MMPPRIPFWEKFRGLGPCTTWWTRRLGHYRVDDGEVNTTIPKPPQEVVSEENSRRAEEMERNRSFRVVRRPLERQLPRSFSYTECAKDAVTWLRYWESRIAPTSSLADFTREWSRER